MSHTAQARCTDWTVIDPLAFRHMFPIRAIDPAVGLVAAANNYLLPAWMIGFGVGLVITSRTERLTPAHV